MGNVPGMSREGLKRRWSKSPGKREEEERSGRGKLWYKEVGGDRALDINSAHHRTKRRVKILGVATL